MAGLFKQPKRRLKKLLRDGEYTDAIVFGKNLDSNYTRLEVLYQKKYYSDKVAELS